MITLLGPVEPVKTALGRLGGPPSDAGTVDPAGFLATVLPSKGHRCIALLSPSFKGMRQLFGLTDAWATTTAERANRRDGVQAYFACSSYRDATSRAATNVLAVRSFWLDLDCGPKKPFRDPAQALLALKAFCSKVGLPIPMLVSSGAGVHCYWPMTEDLDPGTWRTTAGLLKAATAMLGLEADPSRTADIASVLRPVGTHNKKGDLKLVRLLRACEPMDHDQFRGLLAAVVGEVEMDLPAAPAHIKTLAINSDLSGGISYAPSFADRIADRCGVMGLMRETRGAIDQPTWYHCLQVLAKCDDGAVKGHEWSEGDSRYAHDETQRAMDRAANHGPTSCTKLGEQHPEICRACPHSGKIKSPIVLGMAAVTPALVGASSVSSCASMGAMGIPKYMSKIAAPDILKAGGLAYVHHYGSGPSPVIIDQDGGVRRVSPKSLGEMLSNSVVDPGDGLKPIPTASFWMRDASRLEYHRATYDPEGKESRIGEKILNLYRGLSREPVVGIWDAMRGHLLHVICRSNRRTFRYLIYWIAHAVQHPGTAPGTVIVLRSRKEGTGKTTVGVWLKEIYGPHGLMLNTPEQLVSRFNAHLEGISFICLNEPSFPGDRAEGRKLKSMVTEATWMIEPKGFEIYSVPNVAHILLTTNEQWAVPAGNGARRWVVLDVDDSRADDADYFNHLHGEANNGGIEAMLYDLLRLDLSKFDIRDIPRTDALIEQQMLSAPMEVQWALDAAENSQSNIPFGAGAATSELHADYQHYTGRAGGRRPMGLTQFGRWLAGLGLPTTQVGPERLKGWMIPPPDQFAALVRLAAGIHVIQ
jgi:hypothetical protein